MAYVCLVYGGDGLKPKADRTNGHFVFVSYSHHESEQIVFEYIQKLQGAGVRVWYDDGMYSGETWYQQAEQQIARQNCIGVLFFVSDRFLRSPACRRETQFVENCGCKKYLVVDLMSEDITEKLDALLADTELDENFQRPFREMFQQDIIYLMQEPDLTQTFLDHMNHWGYDGGAEFFPCSDVMHNGHSEYLPALLRFTPFHYTFFIASTEQRWIADSLNSLYVFEQEWTEYKAEDAQKNGFPQTNGGGMIIIMTKGNTDLLSEVLSAYAGRCPLVILFSASDLQKAEDMLNASKDEIIRWRESRRVPQERAALLDDYFAVQMSEKNNNRFVPLSELEEIFEESCERCCQLMLSAGRAFPNVLAWYQSRKDVHLRVDWLLFQEAVNGQEDEDLCTLKYDMGLSLLCSREKFKRYNL